MKAKATGCGQGSPGGEQEAAVAGAVVAGLAHDINNLLQIMVAYSVAVSEALAPEDPLRAEVAEIGVAGEHAARLTQQLLSLASGRPATPQVIDLNQVALGMERMLRHAVGKERRLAVRPAPGLGRVRVDPGQLERVLLNLVVNARDATPEGGAVTIEMSRVVLEEAHAAAAGVTAGPFVMVAVSDDGAGMEAAVSLRVFEPFFTTKEQGMGLGLAVVSSFVKRSGGCVAVHSEPGKGARFEVYLPRVEQEHV